MFFSQDPMLLYPQSPYMQTPAIPRSPPNRPSFLIDDLLVRRQSPYLVPKQPQDHGHDPQVPSSSGNSFNFGMPTIFSRSRKEHSAVYQGTHFINFKPFTTTIFNRACLNSDFVFAVNESRSYPVLRKHSYNFLGIKLRVNWKSIHNNTNFKLLTGRYLLPSLWESC